ILDWDTWQTVRGILTDPKRISRHRGQIGTHYPLTGLVYCGRCDHLMYSSIVKYGLTYWCPETGGCEHMRIRGVDLERLVHELIAERQYGHPTVIETDSVLTALRMQSNQLRPVQLQAPPDRDHRESRLHQVCVADHCGDTCQTSGRTYNPYK
ncbi:MAG: hypothetical protein JWM71_1086, partial [Solirubrobacteraceae bacterium]|nr:hypothetical protein [Solirubrobacteraceae bacterium]